MRLPMASTAEPQSPSSSAEKARPAGPSFRVLVVDDNRDMADSLAMLLRESGHEVRTARDGLRHWKQLLLIGPTWCCWTSAYQDSTDLKWRSSYASNQFSGT